jgi:hypothetical protein
MIDGPLGRLGGLGPWGGASCLDGGGLNGAITERNMISVAS